jgi:hypothetical protein
MIWAPMGLGSPVLWPCCLQPTWPISWADSTHFPWLSFSDAPCSWHLKHWSFHCSLGFTHTASHISLSRAIGRDLNSVAHCLAFQAFFWNLGGSLCDPCSSCMLHVCKTNITRMMPRSAANLSSNQALLDHGCSGLWVTGWLSTMKWVLGKLLPRWSCVSRALQRHSSQGKVFQMILLSQPLVPVMGRVWSTSRWPSKHLSYCPLAKYLAWFFFSFFFFVWYCSFNSGPYTCKAVLYHLSHAPSPFWLLVFFRYGLGFFPRLATILLPLLPEYLGLWVCTTMPILLSFF